VRRLARVCRNRVLAVALFRGESDLGIHSSPEVAPELILGVEQAEFGLSEDNAFRFLFPRHVPVARFALGTGVAHRQEQPRLTLRIAIDRAPGVTRTTVGSRLQHCCVRGFLVMAFVRIKGCPSTQPGLSRPRHRCASRCPSCRASTSFRSRHSKPCLWKRDP